MAPGVWFGLAVVVIGGLIFAVSRLVSTTSANIRLQLGQKMDKQAFVRRNVRITRVMGLSFVLIGVVIAILSQTVGRS